MKDIKYQEQTRQSTFAQNSIALPDESSKILAAAKDQVNRMEKNRQDELQYRQQYLRGLQENAWESRKNRADNYRLEQDYNKDYIKALNVRLAADKNKIKLQAQAQQDLYKNLAKTSRKPVFTKERLKINIAPIVMTALLLNPEIASSILIILNKTNKPTAPKAVTSRGSISKLKKIIANKITINNTICPFNKKSILLH